MEWTSRQKEAIETKGKNILVSASAGSGKTAVLSERIVKLCLDDKVNIDRFVVVTFTRLAASEMKARIIKRLEKARENYDDEVFLDEQMILIEKANISTLDSFNVSLLRDYFYMIDIEPNFGIMEQIDCEILKREILDKIFNKYYESKNKDFIDLLKMYATFRDDEGLKKEIYNIYDYAVNMPNPNKALDDLKKLYVENKEVEETAFYEFFKEYAFKILDESIEELKVIKSEISGYEKLEEIFSSDIALLTNLKESINEGYDATYNTLENIKFATLTFPKEELLDIKDEIKDKRDKIKDFIKDLKTNYFKITKEELNMQTSEMASKVCMLIDITREFKEELFLEKKKINKYDFNDLAHLVIELLTDGEGNPTKLALELKDTFKYIIVDEYQDVNEIQETILRAISRYTNEDSNMFMVGDVKQSIYRFRKADPEIFTNKYNSFKENEDIRNMKIDLNQNFRSRKEVLDSINFIFERLMIKDIGNIEYDDEMALKYGNNYKEDIDNNYKTEIDILDYESIKNTLKKKYQVFSEETENVENIEIIDNEKNALNKIIEDISKEEYQAKTIADKINELVENKYQIYDAKNESYKDISYKDISILLRSCGIVGFAYYKMLKKCKVPAILSKQENFINEIEVQMIMSMLKVLDNPYDDVALMTLLYSEYFRFEPEELMLLRKRNKFVNSFYVILKIEEYIEKLKNKEELEDEAFFDKEYLSELNINDKKSLDKSLINKIKRLINIYNHLSKVSKNSTLEELIKEIYTVCDEEKYLLGQLNMKNKINNINLLIELAKKYEEIGNRNIYDFIKFVDDVTELKKDLNVKAENDASDAVNIMTIHGSKGLEFNIVFMPSLERELNKNELRAKNLMDKNLGYVAKYTNVKKGYYSTNFYLEVIKDKINLENLAEEMRVFYVALTRAKEKLYLMCLLKENLKKLDKYNNQISNSKLKYKYLTSINNYIDFYMPQILEDKEEKYFNIENISNVDFDIEANDELESDIKQIFEEAKIEEINNQNFVYPFESIKDIKEKVSVTEIKKIRMQEDEIEIDENIFNIYDNKVSASEILKKFLRKDKTKLTGAEKGTIMHKLVKVITDENVEEKFKTLIEDGMFKEEDLKQIDVDKIKRYVNSELYNRIENSNMVKREMPFMMKKYAKDVFKNQNITSEDEVIVQGIIDCLFEEDGKIVILDYKTDRVYKDDISKEDRINEIVKNYKVQLDLYEEAVKEIFNMEVKEKILYLFDSGDVVNV